MKQNKGLSLFEIVVSLVILALTMAGMVNLFVSSMRHIHHSRSRITGGELGKIFLDPLKHSVREDTWNSNALRVANTICNATVNTAGCAANSDRTLDGIRYDAAYSITDLSNVATEADSHLRKVQARITWEERAPISQ